MAFLSRMKHPQLQIRKFSFCEVSSIHRSSKWWQSQMLKVGSLCHVTLYYRTSQKAISGQSGSPSWLSVANI